MAEISQVAIVPGQDYPVSDDDKRTWLAAGRLIRYPGEPPPGLSADEWVSTRTIPAEMLLKLFDEKTKSCTVPIRLRHVIVEGNLQLNYAACPFEFSVNEDSTFSSEVSLSYTKFFGLLHLGTSTFAKSFTLEFASCSYDLKIEGTVFHEAASFTGISVGGRLMAKGSKFDAKAGFMGIRCTKLASFRSQVKDGAEKVTCFAGEATFLDSKFESTVEFDGVQFGGKVDFGRSAISGNATFRAAQQEGEQQKVQTRFKGPVHFLDAVVGGSVSFDGSEFEAEANFRRLRVGGGLYFRDARFGSAANAYFDNIQVDGTIVFQSAQFEAGCSFEAAQIKGSAIFRSNPEKDLPTKFRGGASFRDINIAGSANFNGAQFWAPSIQPDQAAADFSRAVIGGSAFFRAVGNAGEKVHQTRFVGKVFFDDVSIQGICMCGGAWFSDEVHFRRVQIGSGTYFGIMEIGIEAVRTYFGGQANFHDSHFGGSLDFTAAHFGGETAWDRSVVDGSAFFRPFRSDRPPIPVTFEGNAFFRDVQVSGIGDFSGADFKKQANFVRTKFGGSLLFSTLRAAKGRLVTTRFRGGLRMFQSQIGGDLDMEGAEHDELFELESAHVSGNLLCRAARFSEIDLHNPALLVVARFKKGIRLLGASVEGAADFSESEFGAHANFVRMKVSGPIVFRTFLDSAGDNKTTFQNATFDGAVFSGGADFEGVHFAGVASFVETRIGGGARFSRVQWADWADFRRCEVQGDAYFDREVRFDKTTFQGSRFGKQCLFNGAAFPHGLDFSRSRVDGLLSLAGAEVCGTLSLEDSTVNGVLLELNQAKSKLTNVNLKGLAYGRMSAQWKELFRLAPDDPKSKSHLQPYAQLEKYFRSAGFERDADEVYLSRRKKEWKLLWQGLLLPRSERGQSWLFTLFRFVEESIVRFIFNYGVPSYRLIGVALILFVAGGFLLTLPGALQLRPHLATQPSPTGEWQRVTEAVGAFFATVVPGERSKIFTDWEPSLRPICRNGPNFAQGAAALSLLIYFCMTISVASLAGLIKRKQA